MKFTFKTEKPTGRWASFSSDCHLIKFERKEVGSIGDQKPHEIRLMVMKNDINEDANHNCLWKWITLMQPSNSLQEAKDFLNKNIESILNKYKLHQLD